MTFLKKFLIFFGILAFNIIPTARAADVTLDAYQAQALYHYLFKQNRNEDATHEQTNGIRGGLHRRVVKPILNTLTKLSGKSEAKDLMEAHDLIDMITHQQDHSVDIKEDRKPALWDPAPASQAPSFPVKLSANDVNRLNKFISKKLPGDKNWVPFQFNEPQEPEGNNPEELQNYKQKQDYVNEVRKAFPEALAAIGIKGKTRQPCEEKDNLTIRPSNLEKNIKDIDITVKFDDLDPNETLKAERVYDSNKETFTGENPLKEKRKKSFFKRVKTYPEKQR